jgi:glycosyltransferase involved in cell wall biosynthesis
MVAYTDYVGDARVRREAETLAAHGFLVRCLTTRNGDGPTRYILDGVEINELWEPKYRGKSAVAYLASYTRFLAGAAARCLRLMMRGELDVVHAHNMPDFLVFAGLLPRLAGRKVVLDVHDSMPETFSAKFSDASVLRRLLCLEERISALVAHRVICVNHPQRDMLVNRGVQKSKTFVSMNVPDPRIFGAPVEHVHRSADAPLHLVYHGTMAARLGVDLVIRALARLRAEVPAVCLHLWGRGDDMAGFQRLAVELGVADIIDFNDQGYPLRELPSRLCAMNIGVVGNRRSSAGDLMLPVKLLEYVSLGIPAVVPRLSAIAHYFSQDMVTFYEPDDVASLTKAIVCLHRNVNRRRAQAQRAQEFLASHGWERQGEELVTMYEALVES